MQKSTERARSILLLAQQYLLTSKLILEEMIRSGNPWVITSDSPIDAETYATATRWSDFNTLVPALFLFFHGSELLCKGLIVMADQNQPKTHNLRRLVKQVPRIGKTAIALYVDHNYRWSSYVDIEGAVDFIANSNPSVRAFIQVGTGWRVSERFYSGIDLSYSGEIGGGQTFGLGFYFRYFVL